MRPVRLALVVAIVVALAGACSSGDGAAPSTTAEASRSTTSTSTTVPEAPEAEVPAVPAGVKDCGVTNELAGWPTTTISAWDAYACIVEADAAGTPAQMSAVVVGEGQSGRTAQDGYELPTRVVWTWRVLGKEQVEETVDTTEDGGSVVTRVCLGLNGGYGAHPTGAACTPR